MATQNTGSSTQALVTALTDTPVAYPQQLDLVRMAVLVIGFDEAAYRAASFLDDRVLGPTTRGTWIPVDRAIAAATSVKRPRPLHYIFHTGHVGSTLVSRLLDTAGSTLPLREPLPLRVLAEAADRLGSHDALLDETRHAQLLDTFTSFWRRGFDTTHCVVLKATSAAARLAPRLLRQDAQAHAIYLNVRAEPYLATLLAGANSALDLRGHGPERMRRLAARVDPATLRPLHALSPGELAAMSWLAETLTQRELLDLAPQRVLAVDFEALLADMPGVMQQVARHLAVPVPADWAVRLPSHPALMRYSKSPDHEYSPALRSQVLDQARREHAAEIGRGLAWLDALGRTQPAVARVLTA